MKVKELIKELKKVKNKEFEVYVWANENNRKPIILVDELNDCVDINFEED